MTQEERRARVLAAVNRIGVVLATKNIDVVTMFERLADLAEKSPIKFWTGVNFLK